MKAQTTVSKSIQRFSLPAVTHPWLRFLQQKVHPFQSVAFLFQRKVLSEPSGTSRPSPVGPSPAQFTSPIGSRTLHSQRSQIGAFGSNQFPSSALRVSQGWGCSSCTHGLEQERHKSLSVDPLQRGFPNRAAPHSRSKITPLKFSCSAKLILPPHSNLCLLSPALSHQTPLEIRRQSLWARQKKIPPFFFFFC